MRNRFPGKCVRCGEHVAKGAGRVAFIRSQPWGCEHSECRDLASAKLVREQEEGASAFERGDRSAGAEASHYDRRGVYLHDGTRIGQTGPRCEDAPCCGCCD